MPYAINAAAITAGWLRTVRATVFVSLILAAVLMVATAFSEPTLLPVAVSSACSTVLFGAAAAVGAGYLRRLGGRFDELHQQMLDATRRLELDRYRLQVHDASGVLRMLGDDSTPEACLPALRRQARKESLRIRAYLAQDPTTSLQSSTTTLAEAVHAATEDFTDLPLVIHTTLAEGVVLSEDTALIVRRAVATLLYNVRSHARAQRVTVSCRPRR